MAVSEVHEKETPLASSQGDDAKKDAAHGGGEKPEQSGGMGSYFVCLNVIFTQLG
jgi:hypothetical protein